MSKRTLYMYCQLTFQSEGDGGFAGARETGEPDGAASEAGPGAHDLATFVAGDIVLLVDHIGGALYSLQVDNTPHGQQSYTNKQSFTHFNVKKISKFSLSKFATFFSSVLANL